MTLWQHWMVGQVDASIAAGALLAAAVLARRWLSPRVRSAILLIAFLRLALPPWLRSPWSEAFVDLPPLDDTRLLVTEWLRADVTTVLFTLTTIVSLGLLLRLAWQCSVLAWRLRRLETAPPVLQTMVNRLAGHRSIDVRVSAAGEGPFAAGLFRKSIVLPAALVDRLDAVAMEAVLAHEVAHHARRDLFWITAAALLRAVVWFNPLAHVIARTLVASREDGSDDWAVTRTSRDPFAYAQALLQSARLVAVPPPFAAGAHPMGQRLQRLLDGRSRRDGRPGVAGVAVITLAATLCLPGAHMPDLDPPEGDAAVIVVIKRVIATDTIYQIKTR